MPSHKTLVKLLGVDPEKHPGNPLPTAPAQVTFAYIKHMWQSHDGVIYCCIMIFSKYLFSLTDILYVNIHNPNDTVIRLLTIYYLSL